MDHEEDSLRDRMDSNASSSSRTIVRRKQPKCGRCKTHGINIVLKGHKRYCRYRNCTCGPCLLHDERRDNMRRQTAMKRAQKQDEGREIAPEEVSFSLFIPEMIFICVIRSISKHQYDHNFRFD